MREGARFYFSDVFCSACAKSVDKVRELSSATMIIATTTTLMTMLRGECVVYRFVYGSVSLCVVLYCVKVNYSL